MLLKKSQIPILIIGIILVLVYTFLFASRKNYEFLMYIGVIIFFLLLILIANKKINFPDFVLWGLLVWAGLHMSGGGLIINGKRLYGLMLINIVGEPYYIFRFDQFVHVVGFGIATIALFYLIKPILKKDFLDRKFSLLFVIVFAGLGAGALNEIIEFLATVLMPETGVGGYINTSLDLVADFIGAVLAGVVILWRESLYPSTQQRQPNPEQ